MYIDSLASQACDLQNNHKVYFPLKCALDVSVKLETFKSGCHWNSGLIPFGLHVKQLIVVHFLFQAKSLLIVRSCNNTFY